jgi:hypothetical protein
MLESLSVNELTNGRFVAQAADANTWVVIGLALVAGMIGGWAHKFTTPKEDATPLVGYLLLGAVSSVALLYVALPQTVVQLIALSLLAGYGGKALLDSLLAKIMLKVSESKTQFVIEQSWRTVEIAQQHIANVANDLRGEKFAPSEAQKKLLANLDGTDVMLADFLKTLARLRRPAQP